LIQERERLERERQEMMKENKMIEKHMNRISNEDE
jgi:hypothetical protein